MGDLMFPILKSGDVYKMLSEVRASGGISLVVQLPWSMFMPHEAQAQRNHYQTLKRLAERGGLAASEAVAVLEDRKWESMTFGAANTRLAELHAEWVSAHEPTP